MTRTTPLATAPQVLHELLEALHRRAVSFVILRNYEGLPETWGNDVDVLIHPSDLPLVRKITLDVLRRCDYEKNATAIERLNFWSVSLLCPDRQLQVDFYTAMSKAWCIYAEAAPVLAARRAYSPLFSVPHYLHELILIGAKELLSYGYIRHRYHERLANHGESDVLPVAIALLSKQLSETGCRLVASALVNPRVTGWPTFRKGAIFRPDMMIFWAKKRWSRRQSLHEIGFE